MGGVDGFVLRALKQSSVLNAVGAQAEHRSDSRHLSIDPVQFSRAVQALHHRLFQSSPRTKHKEPVGHNPEQGPSFQGSKSSARCGQRDKG